MTQLVKPTSKSSTRQSPTGGSSVLKPGKKPIVPRLDPAVSGQTPQFFPSAVRVILRPNCKQSLATVALGRYQ